MKKLMLSLLVLAVIGIITTPVVRAQYTPAKAEFMQQNPQEQTVTNGQAITPTASTVKIWPTGQATDGTCTVTVATFPVEDCFYTFIVPPHLTAAMGTTNALTNVVRFAASGKLAGLQSVWQSETNGNTCIMFYVIKTNQVAEVGRTK